MPIFILNKIKQKQQNEENDLCMQCNCMQCMVINTTRRAIENLDKRKLIFCCV